MKNGDIVYHADHPTVPGIILKCDDSITRALVQFSSRISFSGNRSAGYQLRWNCSTYYLFKTPKEARLLRHLK